MRSPLAVLAQLAFASIASSSTSKPAWFTEWSVVRGQAELPCLVPMPKDRKDKPLLVLWYKESQPTVPIYSYDTRSGPFSEGVRWADKGYLGSRAFFRIMSDPPTLVVDDVRVADQAVYTCRVDYKIRPSAITMVNLTIVVPPGPPIILDSTGRTIEKTVGPLEEGSHTHLTCRSVGGSPLPTLTWWRDGHRLDQFGSIRDGSVESRISVVASRSLQGATLSCQALNNNITEASTTALSVEVRLRPLSVEIMGSDLSSPLSSGRAVELVCRAVGSRPPAQIDWYKGSQPITEVTQTVMNEGNVSTGSIVLIPTRHDHNQVVTCRASNPEIRQSVLEDSTTLEVIYKPELQLSLGRALDPNDIKEGDDVYFDCTIEANPDVHKVSWYLNGKMLVSNRSSGVIVAEDSLVLQKVRRELAGEYTCAAHNLEGEGHSNAVTLNIMFAPVCASAGRRTQGVARMESANVVCQVEAYPPKVNFTWRFNGSSEGEAVPLKALHQQGTSSMLNYTASMEHDYGTLLCWAMNKIGIQRNPCVIHLIPAGPPDPPRNCSITNQTSEALVVECAPGFDGGLPQHFLMEAWEQDVLLSNTTSTSPEFVVRGLEPGMGVTLKVRAINTKGQSPAVSFDADIMKVAEKRMGPPEEVTVPPVVGAVVGGVGALLVVIIVGVLLTHYAHNAHVCRRAAKEQESPRTMSNVYAAPAKTKNIQTEEETSSGNTDPDVLIGTGSEDTSSKEQVKSSSRCVEAVAVLQTKSRTGGVTTTLPHPHKGMDVEYTEMRPQQSMTTAIHHHHPSHDQDIYTGMMPQSCAYPIQQPQPQHYQQQQQPQQQHQNPYQYEIPPIPTSIQDHRDFRQHTPASGFGVSADVNPRGTKCGISSTTSLHDLAGSVHCIRGGGGGAGGVGAGDYQYHPQSHMMPKYPSVDRGASVYGTIRRGMSIKQQESISPQYPHEVGSFLASSHQESAV